uniref:Uncharacterized protein n=1 Tax=Candidatus Nitrotoga fabula TaxID=2182327 RepID=A0A2X0QRW8_9PROT|nr:protein of unknown function [Candidatus Nitrotoga fabula]
MAKDAAEPVAQHEQLDSALLSESSPFGFYALRNDGHAFPQCCFCAPT